MLDSKELKKEKDYLRNVLYILEKAVEKNKKKVSDINEDLEGVMKYAWDPTNRLSDTEFTYAIADIHKQSYSKDILEDKLFSYRKMIKNAYFARFDFDDGEDVLPVYLGIATLEDGDFFYVYDWRAPICGMFYDYELGEASYTTPNGDTIKGKITLKRQYKIEGDKIKEVFDTDMQIIDEILQKMLQDNTSGKMKNIVNTIQKEQNKIIRKNDVDVLVVTGPAGSGKTSVAMHKIAYLLYSLKDKITNSNILILSPNDIFSNYISNVLPQIGEKNVYQTTFMDYVKTFLTEYRVVGSMPDIYETIYSNNTTSTEYNSIKLKFGVPYIHLIEKYLEDSRDDLLGIKDIVVDGKVVIEKAYLQKLANEFDFGGMCYAEQYKRLCDRIILHTSIKTQNNKSANAKIRKMLENNKIKPKDIYNKLFSNRDYFVRLVEEVYNSQATPKKNRLSISVLTKIFEYTAQNLSKNLIPFEDVDAYLYLKDRLLGSISQTKIKYVIIDEAQDYSMMQYKILSGIFKNANVTLLGDLNQSIMPFANYKSFDTVLNLVSSGREKVRSESMHLPRTYRSTTEINTFAKSIIPDSPLYNQVDRHGDEVEISKISGNKFEKQIAEAALLKKKFNSVAIITKTQKEANDFKEYILANKKNNVAKVISQKDKVYVPDRVMIIPAYLAKGLEFDAVIISDADKNVYSLEEKNLFYVAVTRALHKLKIYYSNNLTENIKLQNNI
ncbi:MAG: AAA family ATPase [Clostridia bacterium]|nr:AAA family ATPase [Clostridia bacterium]